MPCQAARSGPRAVSGRLRRLNGLQTRAGGADSGSALDDELELVVPELATGGLIGLAAALMGAGASIRPGRTAERRQNRDAGDVRQWRRRRRSRRVACSSLAHAGRGRQDRDTQDGTKKCPYAHRSHAVVSMLGRCGAPDRGVCPGGKQRRPAMQRVERLAAKPVARKPAEPPRAVRSEPPLTKTIGSASLTARLWLRSCFLAPRDKQSKSRQCR